MVKTQIHIKFPEKRINLYEKGRIAKDAMINAGLVDLAEEFRQRFFYKPIATREDGLALISEYVIID